MLLTIRLEAAELGLAPIWSDLRAEDFGCCTVYLYQHGGFFCFFLGGGEAFFQFCYFLSLVYHSIPTTTHCCWFLSHI